MSRTIDERVVSMQFDNKQFERNVSTTMSTLDKLKAKLKLTDASKGFDGLTKAAKKCDLAPLSRATETVGLKFNAMYTMADQALRRITDSAYRAGVNIAKSLTIDPVKTGLQEYETQINAIQTILANTQSKGSTLEDVNSALGELNTYADKTIYNFTEMTRNIGTFTAAGVDLDKSVSSIKGIANLAAVSGSTSQQASTAMYQLSQALASGTVKLMDWNSVVNAGMGGQLFQDALKRTAKQMGHNVDEMIEKYGSFRESLSKGEWLTAEVLTETLTQLSGAYSEADLIAQGYSEKQAKEIAELAETAVNAATKVKTFTQLLDTLKEAAQSGWTQTWQLIIGDFEEAKELWTKVSDVVGGFINKMSESRNNLLEGALVSKWDKLLEKLNEAGVSSEEFEDKVRKTTKEHGQDLDALIKEYGSFEKAIRSGAVSADVLKKALKGVNEQGADLSLVKGTVKRGQKDDQVKQIEGALKALGYDLIGKNDGKNYSDDGYFGTLTEEAIKDFQKLQGLKVTGIVDAETLNALQKATTKTSELSESVFDLVDSVTELGGRELLLESFANLFHGLKTVLTPIAGAFKEIFNPLTSEGLYNFLEGFRDLTAKMRLNAPQILRLKNTFKGLFSILDIVKDVVVAIAKVGFKIFGKATEGLGDGVLRITSTVGTAITKFRDWLEETDKITEVVNKGAKAVADFVIRVRDWVKAFLETPEAQAKIEKLIQAFEPFVDIIDRIREFATSFTKIGSIDELTGKVYGVGDAIKEFGTNLWNYVTNIDFRSIFGKIRSALGGFWTSVSKYLTGIGDKFSGVGEGIMNFIGSVKQFLSDNFGGILAFGFLFGVYKVAQKLINLVRLLNPLSVFTDLVDEMAGAMKSLSLYFKAKAVQGIAVAIAILAGSLAVLSMLDQGKVWSAVGAIGVLLTGIIILINSLNKIDKEKFAEFTKLSVALLGISSAILIMAVAAKTIGNMEGGDLIKAGVTIGAFLLVIKSMAKTTNGISGNLQGFGVMMLALSASLLILAQVAKTFGKMDTGVLIKGALSVAYFLVLVQAMMKATKYINKDLPAFGKVMLGIGSALLLMAWSVKVLGGMDTGALIKGVAGVTMLMAGIVGLMAATKLVTSETKDMARFGRLMSGVGIALIAMSVAVKILGSMDVGDIIKGEIALGAMLAMVAGMMKATQLLTKNSANAGKVGVMMLAFSGAMLLLTGSIAILAMIDGSDIAKATAAIAAIGVVFAGLIAVTKFIPKDCKATLITLSVAVGILAVAITTLSFIDPNRLMGASTALSMIIGMFALLTASTKFAGAKTIGTLIVLTAIVGALAGIIYVLSDIPSDGALKVGLALSALILALSASCVLLAGIGATGPAAFIGIGVLAALMAVIGGFVAIAIASLPAIGTKLSDFMKNLDGFITGAERITPEMGTGMKNLAEALLILTGTAMLNSLGILGRTSLGTFGVQLKTFGENLAAFMRTVSEPFRDLSDATDSEGNPKQIDFEAIESAMTVASNLSDVAKNIPDTSGIKTWWAKKDLGVFGTQISEFASGLVEYLTSMSEPLSTLAALGSPADVSSLNWDNIEDATDIAGKLATIADTIPENVGVGTILWKSKNLGVFGAQIASFASGLAVYLAAMSDPLIVFSAMDNPPDVSELNWTNIDKATGIASDLAAIAKDIPDTSGWGTLFDGKKDLGAFGTQIANFATGLCSYLTVMSDPVKNYNGLASWTNGGMGDNSTLSELNWDNIEDATDIAKKLSEIAPNVPDTSGWSTVFEGKKDLGKFGTQIANFSTGLCTYLTAMSDPLSSFNGLPETIKNGQQTDIGDLNWTTIGKATDIAAQLAALAPSVPDTSMWGAIFSGEKNLGAFGTQLATFANGLCSFLVSMSDPIATFNTSLPAAYKGGDVTTNLDKINTAAIGDAIDIAGDLATLANDVPETSWWKETFSGAPNLGSFGEDVSTFGTGLATFLTTVSGAFGQLESASSSEGSLASVNMDNVNSAVDVATKLGELATVVQQNTAGWDWLMGHENLDDFGTNLTGLADGLSSFSSVISAKEYDAVAVEKAVGEIDKLTGMAAKLNSNAGGYSILSTFGDNVEALGGNLQVFGEYTADLNGANLQSIATGLILLSNINVNNADTLQEFINALGSISGDGLASFVKTFEDSKETLKTVGSNLVSNVILGIAEKFEGMQSAGTGLANAAVSATKTPEMLLAYLGAGGYFVSGFTSGITMNTFKAQAAATAMAKAALKAAETTLDINSPSKETTKIGNFFGLGFINALGNYETRAYDASERIAESAKSGLSNAISRVQSLIDGGMDGQPTIRPVLDLSEVEAGAGAIGGMFGMRPSVGLTARVGSINASIGSRQNGGNGDIISAIKDLGNKIGTSTGDTYNVGDVTYDDGSNVANTVRSLTRAVRVERRR